MNKMSKHTPGPWAVGSASGHIETANAWRMSIATCYNKDSKADGVSKEEFAANARLIAAAPELLDALVICESNIASLLWSCHPKVYGEWLNVVRSAIDKAIGVTK